MKRIISLVITLMLIMSLCACSVPACEHTYSEANCQTPKTCTLCGVTEGTVIDHSYSNGKCVTCNVEQPNYHAFSSGRWMMMGLIDGSNEEHEELDIIYLNPNSNEDHPFVSVSFYQNFGELTEDEQDWYMNELGGKLVEYNGQKYSSMQFGVSGNLTFTDNGDAVTAEIERGEVGTLLLERVAGNQFRVASKTGVIIDSIVDTVVVVGSIFTFVE